MDKIKSLDTVMVKLGENLTPQQKIFIVGDYPLFKNKLIRENRSILEKDNKNKVVVGKTVSSVFKGVITRVRLSGFDATKL